MADKGTYVNFWSLIEAYDPKYYDVIIEKVGGEDKLRIAAYRKIEFNIFGFKVSKQKLKVEWIIDTDIDRNIFDHVVNPDFKDDLSVNCSAFMKYAEQGFNENQTGNHHLDVLHCAVGMSGESGEVLDHIKKHIFHGKKISKTDMIDEIGDTIWYMFNLMRLYGISFSKVLKANKIKLDTRYPNGRTKNILIGEKDKNTEKENIKDGLGLDS